MLPAKASKAGGALQYQDLAPACLSCLPSVTDKCLLQQQVLERIVEELLQAEQTMRGAHETVTHKEDIAENVASVRTLVWDRGVVS